MRTIRKTVYVTSDDTEFADRDEAKRHELFLVIRKIVAQALHENAPMSHYEAVNAAEAATRELLSADSGLLIIRKRAPGEE